MLLLSDLTIDAEDEFTFLTLKNIDIMTLINKVYVI